MIKKEKDGEESEAWVHTLKDKKNPSKKRFKVFRKGGTRLEYEIVKIRSTICNIHSTPLSQFFKDASLTSKHFLMQVQLV